MKRRIIYTLVFAGIGLCGCHKETSIENGSGAGLASDMVATVGSQPWQAADSSQSAVFSMGYALISGSSADGRQINITLNDTVVGSYVLDQSSPSVAIYANLDSSYVYSTNQGSDTSQAGGTVNVLSIDPARRTLSGIFSFKAYNQQTGGQLVISQGVFYNIPYVDQ